jgi:hypothetical protein
MKKANTTRLTLLALGLASTASATTCTWTGNGADQLIKAQGNVNFADGVSRSFGLTIAGYGSSFETEWNQGDLTYVAFKQSNSNFADHFTVDVDTLRVVPELSTYALLAGILALTSVMIRRRQLDPEPVEVTANIFH